MRPGYAAWRDSIAAGSTETLDPRHICTTGIAHNGSVANKAAQRSFKISSPGRYATAIVTLKTMKHAASHDGRRILVWNRQACASRLITIGTQKSK